MRTLLLMVSLCGVVVSGLAFSATQEEEMQRMQQQLNSETLAQPFLAEEPEKVDAYIKEAMKKKLKPVEYTGTNWRSGYTCHDLLRFSWSEYRDCMYYYRYNGRYYPYP